MEYRKIGRTGGKKKYYLIKWKNYPEDDCTWEPESNLSCGSLLYNFHRRRAISDNRLAMAHIADEGGPSVE